MDSEGRQGGLVRARYALSETAVHVLRYETPTASY